AARPFRYRDGAYLREIFPHNVQSPAADHRAVIGSDGHAELLDALVEIYRVLVEQPPGTNVPVDQIAYYPHIRGACLTDCVAHSGPTVPCTFHGRAAVPATAKMGRKNR